MMQPARNIVPIVGICLSLVACNRPGSSSTPNLGGSSGSMTWATSDQNDKPVPGIDQASVFFEGTAFVVWSDAVGGGSSGSSSTIGGMEGHGQFQLRDNRLVSFRFETKDGKTGPVTINEANYDLANGGLFLVSARGEQIRVKQLKRDLRDLKFEQQNLQAFARKDQEIMEFFSGNAAK
jgi:hypothetical protein